MAALGSPLLQVAAREVGILATIVGLGIIAGWVLFIVFGARWIRRDARQRGHFATGWTVLFVLGALLGLPGAIVLLIYVFVRAPNIKYTDQGHLHVPSAPAAGQPLAPPPPPLGGGVGPPALAPAASMLQPLPIGARMSRVKCPRCHSIFEYQRALQGPTHVKCPSCGEEGNI